MFNFIISDIHIKFVNGIGSGAIALVFYVIILLKGRYVFPQKKSAKIRFYQTLTIESDPSLFCYIYRGVYYSTTTWLR